MHKKIVVEQIENHNTLSLLELWKKQFAYFCSDADLYEFWENNTQEILEFIRAHAQTGRGVVARIDNEIVGYLVYDAFCFHGAESAFIPFAGNASIQENREIIYSVMYQELAKTWVNAGIKSHYITIPFSDNHIKNALFDIGFGSYLIDAFSNLCSANYTFDKSIIIEKAIQQDVSELYDLVKLSNDYYRDSPIYLNRENVTLEELEKLVYTSNVFVAKHFSRIVGFLNLTIAEEDDVLRMCAKNFGSIDEIGAYIIKEYRNRNIGNQLLNEAANFCMDNKISCVHVDFETSNLYANKFWRKFFNPVMISLKRTIHADI
ncbi:MAG: GNAT family N-acetyltransferase [Clostridia bacterium]|nr:GNAT family N-acetyltransferase [Clostridia bacterium]